MTMMPTCQEGDVFRELKLLGDAVDVQFEENVVAGTLVVARLVYQA
jgi:hypothetical protein